MQELKTFIETATMQSICIFDDALYKQIDSVSMISPFEPVVPYYLIRHILEARLLCKNITGGCIQFRVSLRELYLDTIY